ncbi:MAG: YfhO family protein [Lachnospiraceae bacterium]|nr:YfhO family protein [Lachnospiraceae bacterium]
MKQEAGPAQEALWAAFLVPVFIMIVIFIQRGIFPFGDASFLRIDMYHQYAPFVAEFRHKLTTGASLLYSWDVGMGVNFSALYAYYLASPLNWLIVLCPKAYVLEFMTYQVVLKTGLCGLTFAYYLRKHCKTMDFGVAFFGVFYAMSGYMAAYNWNIMWLDCIVLFPIIMLGLERLVKKGRCTLYCLTLAVSIASNYYISIMICMFMVIYFIALLVLSKGKSYLEYERNILHFSVFSLLAGGLAAVVLLPEIYALQATASANFQFPKTVQVYFSMIDMFARHLANSTSELGLDHWPNVYCGMAVFLFVVLYYGSSRIRLKEKVVYSVLLIFFLASFSINVLNFIWHGLHYPNSLPARQSFIYIFLVLFVCYRAYMYLDDALQRHIVVAFWVSIGFVLLAQTSVVQDQAPFWAYYVAMVFLMLYAGLLILYKQGRLSKTVLLTLALILVITETGVNMAVTSITTVTRSAYMADADDVRKLVATLPEGEFYRIDKTDFKAKDESAWINYPSLSLFSSTADAGVTEFFKRIGCEGNTNAYAITGSTPLVDMLFSARYALYPTNAEVFPDTSGGYYRLLGIEGDVAMYERTLTLPVAFGVAQDFEKRWKRDWYNPVTSQNALCELLGVDPVLREVAGDNANGSFHMYAEAPGDYYLHVANRDIEDLTVIRVKPDGEERSRKAWEFVSRGYLIEIEGVEAGEEVRIEIGGDQSEANPRIIAYRFVQGALNAVYDKLNGDPMVVTEFKDTKITGAMVARGDLTVFTSIPYDKGWEVRVDGEKVATKTIFNAFLSFPVKAGQHIITFSYMPPGLILGANLTGGCILAFVLLFFVLDYSEQKRRRRSIKMAKMRMEWMFGDDEDDQGGDYGPRAGRGRGADGGSDEDYGDDDERADDDALVAQGINQFDHDALWLREESEIRKDTASLVRRQMRRFQESGEEKSKPIVPPEAEWFAADDDDETVGAAAPTGQAQWTGGTQQPGGMQQPGSDPTAPVVAGVPGTTAEYQKPAVAQQGQMDTAGWVQPEQQAQHGPEPVLEEWMQPERTLFEEFTIDRRGVAPWYGTGGDDTGPRGDGRGWTGGDDTGPRGDDRGWNGGNNTGSHMDGRGLNGGGQVGAPETGGGPTMGQQHKRRSGRERGMGLLGRLLGKRKSDEWEDE